MYGLRKAKALQDQCTVPRQSMFERNIRPRDLDARRVASSQTSLQLDFTLEKSSLYISRACLGYLRKSSIRFSKKTLEGLPDSRNRTPSDTPFLVRIAMAPSRDINDPNTFVFYRYHPSLLAAVIFVLFGLTPAVHVYQMYRKRAWFLVPFIIGGLRKYITHRVVVCNH